MSFRFGDIVTVKNKDDKPYVVLNYFNEAVLLYDGKMTTFFTRAINCEKVVDRNSTEVYNT